MTILYLGEVEEEGVTGEIHEVGSSLADADVAQDAQPPLIPLLLRLLCAEGAHCARQQEHLFCNLSQGGCDCQSFMHEAYASWNLSTGLLT